MKKIQIIVLAFVSTRGSGNIWNPTKDADGNPREVADENDYIEGIYVDKKEGIGRNDANIYTIEKEDGSRYDVWGTTSLNGEFGKIRLGSTVKIQWHGKKLTKSGEKVPVKQRQSTDSFHDYEVFVDDSVPLKQMTTQVRTNTPTGANKGANIPTSGKNGNAAPISKTDDLPF